jgi:hypothetical protein
MDKAREFAGHLSRRVLRDAPGLELVIVRSDPFEFDPSGSHLPKRTEELFRETLAQKKRTRRATPTPMLGMGVSAECAATGVPATEVARYWNEDQFEELQVSAEVAAKLKAVGPAKDRLTKLMTPRAQGAEFMDFTDQTDWLGHTPGRESYVAIVHADGNSMGSRLRDIGRRASTNREYIQSIRNFSQTVNVVGRESLSGTLIELYSCIRPKADEEGKEHLYFQEPVPAGVKRPAREFKLRTDGPGASAFWPVRPLVFGGDDVTFICVGRLGLTLAVTYLKQFHELSCQHLDVLKTPLYGCAGVSIVKAHYPFHRAYQLSEDLAKNAKQVLGQGRSNASALDWHFSTAGLAGSLGAIREREYQTRSGSLLMRPLLLEGDSRGSEFVSESWRCWDAFRDLIRTLAYGDEWAARRNKTKALREALREGPDAVTGFLRGARTSELPNSERGFPPDAVRTGWAGKRTPYFDAIEMGDHTLLMS